MKLSSKLLNKRPFSNLNEKAALSQDAKIRINKLAKRDAKSFLMQLVMAWLIVLSSVWMALYFNNIFITIFAIFIIATRQNILGLLVHEQVHCLGFKAKFGDKFTNFFAAYPLLILTVEDYAKAHLSHHKFFMTEQDQDLIRKNGENWQFPMKAIHLLKLFLMDIICLNLWKMIKEKKLKIENEYFNRPNKSPVWLRPTYYVLLAILLTFTHTWGLFLMFWVLPLLTFGQIILRWGAICEHQYVANASIADCSPIIILSWWEKILCPNLNFTLHPYHHYFPGVPFSKLPEVHQIFLKEGLVNADRIYAGNFDYLRFIIEKEETSLQIANYEGS